MSKLFDALKEQGITVLGSDGIYDDTMYSDPFKCHYKLIVGDYTNKGIRTELLSSPVNEDIATPTETSYGWNATTPDGDKISCVCDDNDCIRFTKTLTDGTIADSDLFPFTLL